MISSIAVSFAALVALTLAAPRKTIPIISQHFCADMHDHAIFHKGGAVVKEQNLFYHLCLDRDNVRYARVTRCDQAPGNATCGSFPSRNITYVYKNQTSYVIAPTDSGDGVQCYRKAVPSTNTQIPFDFVMIDDSARGTAHYVNETTLRNKTVSLWEDVRIPGQQTMDWYVVGPDASGVSDFARSTCYNQQDGIASVASRDFFSHYSRKVSESAFHIPAAILSKCTAPPTGSFLGMDSVFLQLAQATVA